MAEMAQFEWTLSVLVLGFLIWELVSIRRTIRRDREEAARKARDQPPP